MRATSFGIAVPARNVPGPNTYGLLAQAFDPAVATSTATPLATAGTIYVIKLEIEQPLPAVTNIVTFLTAAGVTLTSVQCFAALYQGGVLKGVSAGQAALWESPGLKTMPIQGGPVSLDAGFAYVGLWFNGTTGPAPLRGNSASAVNLNLAATASRFGTANTGVTTTAPATLGTISAAVNAYWAGLS